MWLKKGDTLKLLNGDILAVDSLVGEGANGEVYKCLSARERAYVALKFMYGTYSTDNSLFCKKVSLMARAESPHPDLVWFIRGAVSEFDRDSESFAFAMPLLQGYHGFSNAIRDPSLLTAGQKAEACFKIAKIFHRLRTAGYMYTDVSGGNVMYRIEPDGHISVKLIDPDNVTLPKYSLGLMGTGLYRAPEILLNEAPTYDSDAHALAVLVFRILMRRHPLDTDEVREHPLDAENVLHSFGEAPRFLFDGRAPASQAVNARWRALPDPLKLYFRLMFSHECLKEDPTGRPDPMTLLKVLHVSYPDICR